MELSDEMEDERKKEEMVKEERNMERSVVGEIESLGIDEDD